MGKLRNDTKAKDAENDQHVQKIQAQREKDALEGNKGNPECVKGLKEIGDLEKALDRAREQNRADLQNTRKLKVDFDKLKDQYYDQIDDLKKKLDAENRKRENGQNEANSVEEEIAGAARTNFELKKEAFERAVEKAKLENKMKQADRNMKLINEKKKILDRQLATAKQLEDKEAQRAQNELNKANIDLERQKKEAETAQMQLDQLQRENDDWRSKGWEDKIFKLEIEVNKIEEVRN